MVGVGKAGRPYLDAARRLGLQVHVVETAEHVSALESRVDGTTVCRGGTDELWTEAAFMAAHTCRPDGVIAFSEPHVMAGALVADEFGLPGPSLRAAVFSRNKGLQRARFSAAGIDQPEYLVTNSVSDATEWVATRMPVVLKPLSSAGSNGVELVADAKEYQEAAVRRNSNGRMLVERAMGGPEYSWEALVLGGEVWASNLTAKETTGPPNFIEVAHRVPADVDGATRTLVTDLGTAVLNAIGMRTGLIHLEFRLTPGGPAVIEVAVRTPGDCLMDLLGLAYGLDWFELVIRAAMGWELPSPPQAPLRIAASYLPSAPSGTVVAIEGLAEVLAQPNVVTAEVSVSPGDRIAPLKSSNERVGQVVLAADAPEELTHTVSEVRRILAVVTRPD
ncbi:ATP-grasp domain-containing protein [Lipingzhangella sp. LS1_29]|uniref:ATP-grasp domain-containing protein n=1 Tax=Lipingzhangella rawalii TaxID=2055835 RepID=A0ABU2HB74_9ACTN|nr:ATP-grasp domain-containing protein [Lipingzhangella rawalii]MDS1272587.1 ATP-grasp domain-containing protein [Lipingzhangella rawalii]